MHWTISPPTTKRTPVPPLPDNLVSPTSNGLMTADHATTIRETIKADKQLALGRRAIGGERGRVREVAIRARVGRAIVRVAEDEVASVDAVAAEDPNEAIEEDEVVVAEVVLTTRVQAVPMDHRAPHPNSKQTPKATPVLGYQRVTSLPAHEASLPFSPRIRTMTSTPHLTCNQQARPRSMALRK